MINDGTYRHRWLSLAPGMPSVGSCLARTTRIRREIGRAPLRAESERLNREAIATALDEIQHCPTTLRSVLLVAKSERKTGALRMHASD
jgi:hypothetical protein